MKKLHPVGLPVAALAGIGTISWYFMDWAASTLRFEIAGGGDTNSATLDLLLSTSDEMTGYCVAIVGFACAVLFTQKRVRALMAVATASTFLLAAGGAYVGLALKFRVAEVLAGGAAVSATEDPLWWGIELQWRMLLSAIVAATFVFLLITARKLAPQASRS